MSSLIWTIEQTTQCKIIIILWRRRRPPNICLTCFAVPEGLGVKIAPGAKRRNFHAKGNDRLKQLLETSFFCLLASMIIDQNTHRFYLLIVRTAAVPRSSGRFLVVPMEGNVPGSSRGTVATQDSRTTKRFKINDAPKATF